MVHFTLPSIPPSVNHYKSTRNGRYFTTGAVKEWYNLCILIASRHQVRGASYAIDAVVTLGKGQRGDVDNFAKCLLDGLVKAGSIDTDAKVDILTMKRVKDNREGGPMTTVTISVLE